MKIEKITFLGMPAVIIGITLIGIAIASSIPSKSPDRDFLFELSNKQRTAFFTIGGILLVGGGYLAVIHDS